MTRRKPSKQIRSGYWPGLPSRPNPMDVVALAKNCLPHERDPLVIARHAIGLIDSSIRRADEALHRRLLDAAETLEMIVPSEPEVAEAARITIALLRHEAANAAPEFRPPGRKHDPLLDVAEFLRGEGFSNAQIATEFGPPWTTRSVREALRVRSRRGDL